MFGQNEVMKQETSESEHFWVQEVFGTVQGEGPNAGEPAVFLRMAGCNMRCHFCDTDFESSSWFPTINDIFDKVSAVSDSMVVRLLVITGGEPFRQNVVPIVDAYLKANWTVQFETAGTLWLDDLPEAYIREGLVEIICSPKAAGVHPKILEHCSHWKYIIRDGEFSANDGLPIKSTQSEGRSATICRPPPGATVWLQPCEEYENIIVRPGQPNHKRTDVLRTKRNTQLCAELAMKHGYKVSLQLHKILELP